MNKSLALIVSLSAVLIFSSCGSKVPDSSSQKSSASSSLAESSTVESSLAESSIPSPESKQVKLTVGDTGSLGEFEFTVDNYEILDSVIAQFGKFNPDDGNKYLVVTLSAKNLERFLKVKSA